MSSWNKVAIVAALVAAGAAAAADRPWNSIGRAATPAEIAAWDIDVRPDGTGLPPGHGSVTEGRTIYDAKCSSCHGEFGDSNAYLQIAGGVGSLATAQPVRTTGSKLNYATTLWDYINRAMPFQAPKSLSADEVYALTAYVLFLNDIVPEDTVLDRDRLVKLELPNRNGFTQQHGFQSRDGIPDAHNTACHENCGPAPVVKSEIPDHARNAHGNLALQTRLVGPVRGADTTQATPVGALSASRMAKAASEAVIPPAARTPATLMRDLACGACHSVSARIVGPAFRDVANRYRGKAEARQNLLARIRSGGSGTWGTTPMPPQAQGSEADLAVIVDWILAGAKQD